MAKKRRTNVRLAEDEALVVAPLGFWEGVENLFRELSTRDENVQDEDRWLQAAEHISYWAEKTKSKEDATVADPW